MINEVKINGKSYPISFGLAALKSYEDATGKSAAAVEMDATRAPISTLIDLCYYALKDGARKAKKEFTLTVLELADMFDDDPAGLEKCQAVFIDSQAKGSGTAGDDDKKKVGP